MPIYEYECSACGHQFEEWQKISDSPIRKCPECKKRKVQRLVSASAFHLKGGGWYTDGYGNGGGSKKTETSPSAKKPAASSNAAKSSAASESK